MYDSRKARAIFVVLFLVIFVAAMIFFVQYEQSFCMGARIVSLDFFDGYSDTLEFDITQLTFNNEKIAADIENNTVYISQSEEVLSSYTALEGSFGASQGYSLYFTDSVRTDNIKNAVSDGRSFSLYIVSGGLYKRVDVVISTLPVLRLEGDVTHLDESDREVFEGNLALWSGFDVASESYTVHTCNVEWHVRGGTTSTLKKTPWKLSLKDNRGKNYDCNFVGAGADDDWILNPMIVDDSKVREKVMMDFWQLMAEERDVNYSMSQGDYVEVVVNGEYRGLYLLQRRVDEKYLQLNRDEDILLKGHPSVEVNSVRDAYEIVSSPYSEDKTYAIIEEMVNEEKFFNIELDNFIDVNLLINYFVSLDNRGFKNMFYVLQATDNGYEVSLVPWDTDMSLGIMWESNFRYNYEKCMSYFPLRREYALMSDIYSDLDQQMLQVWKQLRTSIYTKDVIHGLIDKNMAKTRESGAYVRDNEKWGKYFGEFDLEENVYRFCEERLTVLDEYYGN